MSMPASAFLLPTKNQPNHPHLRTDARAVQLEAEVTAARLLGVSAIATTSPTPVDFVGLSPPLPGGGVPLAVVLEALFQVGRCGREQSGA